ncbi:MAG TPA: DUF3089 domain-containing protein [Polyangiaceae bacterium]|nr:DUF3089 domain-containing protein [Polyangiaceae bacterium]
MGKWKRAARTAGLAVLVVGLAGVLVAWNIGALVRVVMAPGAAFDREAPPAAPDYADPRSWSALPERDDLADRAPAGVRPVDPRRAGVDVFYVHPTSHVGSRWNAPVDDPALNDATDRVATGIQASAFNGCCAVYAPRYRQANGTAFYSASADGDRAIDLAYGDVRRAFDAFNARRGPGRPFFLASHSQGTVLLERLLYEAVSGADLRNQLVAAYLVGGRITEAGLRERAPDLPPCRAPDDRRCVIAWNARGPLHVPTAFELHRPDARERLCTNPLSWRADGAHAPATLNLGAVFLESDDLTPRVAFADAQCVNGTLVVSHIGAAPRDLPSRILDHVMGDGNYHAIEYQLFFMNVWQNAVRRAGAGARE